jgi:hypothetical protein
MVDGHLLITEIGLKIGASTIPQVILELSPTG